MAIYRVSVIRDITEQCVVIVEAADAQEAKEKAYEAAENSTEWSTTDLVEDTHMYVMKY
jgi:hypothetical protein